MCPSAILSALDKGTASSAPRLKLRLCSLSVLLGLILAILGVSFGGDGVSYLDMGDSFFAGDRMAIVNGLWSPLFPLLHGFTRWLLKPSMEWQPAVVGLTNLLIFAAAILSFQFFWGQLHLFYKDMAQRHGQTAFALFSDSQFWLLGYLIFLFFHLDLAMKTSPDMLLSAFVYLAAGLILRIKLLGPTLLRFCILGLFLALGFLAKAVMLPLAGVFLATAVLPAIRWKFALACALASTLVFSAVVSPYVWALSRKQGHFTAGDAGSLNYAWHVNEAPFVHWQGEPPGLGTSRHSTRKIFSSPQIYEFATPLRATYPPWYDPSYWNNGLHPKFAWAEQLAAFKLNLARSLRFLLSQAVLIVGILLLLAMRQWDRAAIKEVAGIWSLWVPALAAFAFYLVVWVEGRYLSQFFLLFWAAALVLVRLPEGPQSRRLLRAVVLIVVTLLSLQVLGRLVRSASYARHEAKLQMHIAKALTSSGIRAGEKVAVIDAQLGDEWQKLARLSIVAEIPDNEENKFWIADPATRLQIDKVLADTGATLLIATGIPDWAPTNGWQRLASAPVYVHRLPR